MADGKGITLAVRAFMLDPVAGGENDVEVAVDNVDIDNNTAWVYVKAPTRLADHPPIVVLCGSTRFKDQFVAEQWRLSLEGRIVLSVSGFGHIDHPEQDWTTGASDVKRHLDALHLRKIDMADEVRVIDVDGYIGDSTRGEIDYAESLGKAITYLSGGTS